MSKACDLNNKQAVNSRLETKELKDFVSKNYNSKLYVEKRAHGTTVQVIPNTRKNSAEAFGAINSIRNKINKIFGDIMEQPKSMNNGVAYSSIKFSENNLEKIRNSESIPVTQNEEIPVEPVEKLFFNINEPDVVRKESIPKLNDLLSNVMAAMGVSIETMKTYKQKHKIKTGKELDQLGVANIVDGILAYSEDDGVTLPEEAMHFIVENNWNNPEFQDIVNLRDTDGILMIAKTNVWKDNYDSYLSLYGNQEDAIKEVIGKILAQYIYDKYDNSIPNLLKNALKRFINFITFGLAKLKITKQLDRNKFNIDLQNALNIVVEKVEQNVYNQPLNNKSRESSSIITSPKFRADIQKAIVELQRRISTLLEKDIGLKGDTAQLEQTLMNKYYYTNIQDPSQYQKILDTITFLSNEAKTRSLTPTEITELHEHKLLQAIAVDEFNSQRVVRNSKLVNELSDALKIKQYQLGIVNYITGNGKLGGVQKEINELIEYTNKVIKGELYLDLGRYNSLYNAHNTHSPIINVVYNLYLNGGSMPDLSPLENADLKKEITELYNQLQFIDQFLVSNVEQVTNDFYIKYQRINPNLKVKSRLSEISLANYMFGSLKNVKEDLGRIFYNKLFEVHSNISESVYNKVTDLHNLIREDLKKMTRDSYQKLKEKDDNGKFTGYFTSEVKTWLYEKNREEFLENLRKEIIIHARTKFGRDYAIPTDLYELEDFFNGASISEKDPVFYTNEMAIRDELKSIYFKKIYKWEKDNTETIPNVLQVIKDMRSNMNRSQFKRWYSKNVVEYELNGVTYYRYKGELIKPKKQLYENPEYAKLLPHEKNVLETLKNEVIKQKRRLPKKIYSYSYNHLLPQVSKSLLDTITSSKDLGKNLTEKIKETYSYKEDDSFKADRYQGFLLDRPPLRYLNKIDPDIITDDLFRSTTLMIEMSENYIGWIKNLPEINGMIDIVRFSDVERNSINKLANNSETSFLQKKMQELVETTIYGEEVKNARVAGIDLSKVSSTLENYVRRLNLTFRFPAIIMSYISGKVNTYRLLLTKSISGESYKKGSLMFYTQLPEILNSYQTPTSNNKFVVLARSLNLIDTNSELFSDLDKYKATRSASAIVDYGGYRASDVAMKYPILASVAMDIKFVNGNWSSYKTYNGSKTDWNNAKSLWDMVEVVDNKLKYDPLVNQDIKNLFKSRVEYLTKVADLQSNKFDKAIIQTHALGRFLAIHMNWFYESMGILFKPAGFNYQTQQEDKGVYTSLQTIAKAILSKDFTSLARIDKDNALQIAFFLGSAYLINVLTYVLNAIALDEDDDEIDPFLAYVIYLSTRLSLELSAYISGADAIEYVSKPIAGVDKINNILSPILYLISLFSEEDEVEKGIYKGYDQSSKTLIKSIPGIAGFFETFAAGYVNEILDKPNDTISVSILDKNDYLKNKVINQTSLLFEMGSLLTKPAGYGTGKLIGKEVSKNYKSKNLLSLPTKKENE